MPRVSNTPASFKGRRRCRRYEVNADRKEHPSSLDVDRYTLSSTCCANTEQKAPFSLAAAAGLPSLDVFSPPLRPKSSIMMRNVPKAQQDETPATAANGSDNFASPGARISLEMDRCEYGPEITPAEHLFQAIDAAVETALNEEVQKLPEIINRLLLSLSYFDMDMDIDDNNISITHCGLPVEHVETPEKQANNSKLMAGYDNTKDENQMIRRISLSPDASDTKYARVGDDSNETHLCRSGVEKLQFSVLKKYSSVLDRNLDKFEMYAMRNVFKEKKSFDTSNVNGVRKSDVGGDKDCTFNNGLSCSKVDEEIRYLQVKLERAREENEKIKFFRDSMKTNGEKLEFCS